MKCLSKAAVVTLLATALGSSLLIPMTVRASEEGDRNSTLVLGALSGFFAARGDRRAAAATAAGAAIAHDNWQDDIDERHRREDERRYRHDRHDDRYDRRDDRYDRRDDRHDRRSDHDDHYSRSRDRD